MKRFFLLAILFFLNECVFSQAKTKSVELYDLGNIAYANKDYKKADSLFTLSLELERYPDTYFNRAASRKKLNDISGYCLDMLNASHMFDAEAEKLFNKDCIKIDTIFSKEGDRPAKIADFEIAEIYTSYAYKSNVDYEKYDKNSNLIRAYELINLDTLYHHNDNASDPEFPGGNEALIKYLSEKIYSMVKVPFWGSKQIIISLNANGKIVEAEKTEMESSKIIDSICLLLKKGPDWIPGKFNGRPVPFKKTLYLRSYGKTISVEELAYQKRVIGEVFTQVETMPEFPGGPLEMMKYIQKNLVYPKYARDANITGKCFLKFIVKTDGVIGGVEVLKGVAGCRECDIEAIKVVMSMPKWKPGTQNGNPVPVFFNLPINFTINGR